MIMGGCATPCSIVATARALGRGSGPKWLTCGFVEETSWREHTDNFLVQYRPKVCLRLGYPFLTSNLERERLAQSVRVFEQLIWEITQRRVACVEGEFQVVECGPNVDQVVNKVES